MKTFNIIACILILLLAIIAVLGYIGVRFRILLFPLRKTCAIR